MIIILLIIISFLLYKRGTRNFNYWKNKSVSFCKPLPFFGNSLKKYCQRISPTDHLGEIYKGFPNERYVGCFESNHVALLLKNPEDVKKVLVSDFLCFYSKGINVHQNEPLLNNLFSADGDLWKLLRQNISHAFTTAKFKTMFPTILAKAEVVKHLIEKENGVEINIKDLLSRFTTDVITTCGFGLDTDSLNSDSSIFHQLGKRIFKVTKRDAIVTALKTIFPDVFQNVSTFAPEIERRIHSIYNYLKRARDGKQTARNDFIDILLSIQERGKLKGESITKRNLDESPKKVELQIDDFIIAAQALILYGAGYETTAVTISFTLHQLAFNPEKQKKCQDEIDKVLKNNNLTYESLRELTYLSMAYKEALRMYPPVGFIMRRSMSKYTFSNKLTIDKGVFVLIPVQAIQNDEKYFEKPDEFVPERFHPNNSEKFPKNAYLPFGDGPRICIGQRLGVLQAMVAIVTILRNFTVVPSVNSRYKLSSEPTTALVQTIQGGGPLNFLPRKFKKTFSINSGIKCLISN